MAIRASQDPELKRTIVTDYEYQKSRRVAVIGEREEKERVKDYLDMARDASVHIEERIAAYRNAEIHTVDLKEKRVIRGESKRFLARATQDLQLNKEEERRR